MVCKYYDYIRSIRKKSNLVIFLDESNDPLRDINLSATGSAGRVLSKISGKVYRFYILLSIEIDHIILLFILSLAR